MRTLAALVLAWSSLWVATAQPAKRLEFEVASVKPSPARVTFTKLDRGGPESDTPGSWSCEYYTLLDLLKTAFALHESQISGPAWIESQRFHINARLAPGTNRTQFREMLRNLLVDRFALAANLERRVVSRYELAVSAGGPKLQKSIDRPSRAESVRGRALPGLDADGFPRLGPHSDEPEILTIAGRTSMFFPRTSMKELAEELSEKSGKLTVDLTGLTGEYDIALHWSDGDSGPTLPQALRDQLGLRMVEKKGPLDFLVIERVSKMPTGN